MMLFLVIVSIIAVFTVDCRDFAKGYEDLGSVSEAQQLHGEPMIPTESTNPYDTEVESNVKESVVQGPQEHEFREIGQHLNNPALTKSTIEYSSIEVEEDQQEDNLRRVGCKARNACVVMGGFCVANATLCEGRLVPEGCKGTNCQCCVPGTLEAKIRDLEQVLKTMKGNLTNDNSRFSMELQSGMENLTNADLRLDMELQSEMNNLTDANLKLSLELQNLKDNITESFTSIGSKLDSIMKSCPAGFFHTPGSRKCYIFYKDISRSYTEGKTKCQTEGLSLPEPDDSISLRKYLVDTYAQTGHAYVYVGARGTGSYYRWERSGRQISNTDSLWHSSPSTSTSHCILLLASKGEMASHPNQPYYSTSCTYKYYTLCEYIRE